jgi:hypothetical protein
MPLAKKLRHEHHRLQLKSGTSNTNNSRLDLRGADKSVLIGDVGLGDRTLGSIVGRTAQVNIVDRDGTSLLGVLGGESLLSVGECSRLDKNLSTHARVNTGHADILVVVVEDVDETETDRRSTRSNAGPVVVGVGNVQSTLVLRTVAVGVADERGLVVVVEVGVGHGDEVGGVGDIEETVEEVLVLRQVGRELTVVNPDVGGLLDTDGIAVGSNNVLDSEVANDNVLLLVDVKTDVGERSTSGTDNGLVRLDADLVVSRDLALDVDDLLSLRLSSLAELSEGRDSHGSTTSTTGSTAVLCSVTDVGGISDGSSLAESLSGLLEGRSRDGAGQSSEVEKTEELHVDDLSVYIKKLCKRKSGSRNQSRQ